MNPVLTAVVCEDERGAFHARLLIDGTTSNRECMHNHHSRAAAEKCCAPLVARHAAWFAAATGTEHLGGGLMETTTRDGDGRVLTFRWYTHTYRYYIEEAR